MMKNRNRILMALTLVALLAAGPAIAQIDPDPDGIGLYSDLKSVFRD